MNAMRRQTEAVYADRKAVRAAPRIWPSQNCRSKKNFKAKVQGVTTASSTCHVKEDSEIGSVVCEIWEWRKRCELSLDALLLLSLLWACLSTYPCLFPRNPRASMCYTLQGQRQRR